jgi:hypothetical protein
MSDNPDASKNKSLEPPAEGSHGEPMLTAREINSLQTPREPAESRQNERRQPGVNVRAREERIDGSSQTPKHCRHEQVSEKIKKAPAGITLEAGGRDDGADLL